MTSRYDADRDLLAELLDGEPRYRVDQVWEGLYLRGADPQDLTNLPKSLRSDLAELLPPALHLVTESVSDGGRTVKWLWQLDDGARIETVLMHYPKRSTVCISSQAGCAMACGFCATGQAGFERHLTVGEIVEQVLRARVRAAEHRGGNPSSRSINVVFMGMGEPLANLDRVWTAIERLHGDAGIGARHLTISTVGLVPGIQQLIDKPLPVNLAVSLHAANDKLRNELVPINKRWPIDELIFAIQQHREIKGRRVSFEWAMINGVNDRPSDARELADLAARARAHINLIPLNPTPGWSPVGSPPARIDSFAAELGRLGANATIRANRGTDIDAACGQLRASQQPRPVAIRSL
ncbi:MAG: 23S rRNA (adenine(2503)-C(2))-methyltransferase RlmN [Actinomycetia bacterium]|nr:23S rRNA (adenine(2503)-C(2))-methyltransferase RlmN [Actinomycetes bacterium]